MDLDAALTDGLLATVGWGFGLAALRRQRWLGGVGLVAVGAAAAVGTLRLSVVPGLAALHTGLTAVAGAFGVPALAVGVALHLLRPSGRWAVGAALVLVGGLPFAGAEAYRVGISSAGLAVAVVAGLLGARRDPGSAAAAVVGSVLVAVAGLVIAGEGQWAGLSRIAWFHLALSVALGLLGTALFRRHPVDR